jgi:nucleoredoxin
MALAIGLLLWSGVGAEGAKTPATAPSGDAQASWKEMFPQGLIDASGKAADLKQLQGKIVGLYFSAHWCPPCKVFTPELVKFRNQNAANFEVVFVSADNSKEEQRKYMSETEMKWLAVEWKTAPASALMKKYDVQGIPTLVILGPDGKEITRQGRMDVATDPNSALAKWKKAAG